MPLREDLDQRISAVLETRVDRILLVLESVSDNRNYLAALRTCDVLGVQRVAVIHPQTKAAAGDGGGEGGDEARIEQGRKKNRIARASSSWLDVQHFSSTAAAVAALRAGGWTIWATDLSPGAMPLTGTGLQLPERLAIVMGSESSGISREMRDAADRCVYLPMHGFTESLNVGVASGLVLQALIASDPSVRGDLLGPGRAQQLADKWRAAATRGAKETWPGATVTQAQAKQRRQQQQQQQQEEGAAGEAEGMQVHEQHWQQPQQQEQVVEGMVGAGSMQQQQLAGNGTSGQQAQHAQQAADCASEAVHCLHMLQLQEQPHST